MKYIPWIAGILISIVLCIRQSGEPDIYWQIETGNYILEHGTIPNVDVFSFTYEGEAWTNVKWGTEVLMALIDKSMGIPGLMILNALIIVLILIFMMRISGVFAASLKIDHSKLQFAILPAFLVFLFFMSYRLNGRPEMISHLFTSIYFYLTIDFLNKPSKKIYFLIPLQLLWSNMHEAYGVGMVIILIVAGALIIERNIKLLEGQIIDLSQYKHFFIAGILALITPIFHPMGSKMILYPFNIYGQLSDNQFTTELYGFTDKAYWEYPAYIFILVFIITLQVLSKKWIKSEAKSWRLAIQQFRLPVVLLFMAFFILGLQSYRNMPYFFFMSTPLLILYFSKFEFKKGSKLAIIGFSILFYVFIASGKFYDILLERERYGLRINPERTSIGGAKFLAENNINGKGYVDYLSSSYLLWYLNDYQSYIDLRDLDVFDKQFMENVLLSYQYPTAPVKGGKTLFSLMEEADDFDYAFINNKREFIPILRYLQNRNDWVLVYADPVNSVFIKRKDKYTSLISKYESPNPEQLFYKYQSLESPSWAIYFSKLFWPFYSEKDYSKVSVNREAAIFKRMITG